MTIALRDRRSRPSCPALISRGDVLRAPTCFALVVLLAGAAHADAGTPERLSVVSNGEVVGYVAASREGGTTTVDYHVDNNGRGPKHREVIHTDENGLPVAWRIEGTSLMGGAVEEHYRWENGLATWTSQAGHGEVPAETPPLYIVNDGSPWAPGVYARALLNSPSGKLEVLPAGSISLTRLRELTVGADEGTVAVTVYSIGGVDLAPDFIMLDAERRLFATFGATPLTVREGFEAEGPEILALARELESEHARALQQRLAHPFGRPLRIENVHIFDPESGELGPASTVVVQGERIARVVAGGTETAGGQVVIDGQGGTLVPGLHDMHSHSTLRSGLFYLAAGVTATRDMGNRNDFLLELMAGIEAGEIAGPRITPAGFIEGRSEHSARHGIIAGTLDDALAAADAPYLGHMPIGYQRHRKRSFIDIPTPAVDQRWREAFRKILDTLALLHEEGIRLLPGTDDGTGFTLHRELELYVQAGLAPAEALRLGTLGAEEYLGRDDRLGSIEPGKLADFFLVAGDPTKDIRAIRRPRLVLKGGTVYYPNEIYAALDIVPFTTPPPMTGGTAEAAP